MPPTPASIRRRHRSLLHKTSAFVVIASLIIVGLTIGAALGACNAQTAARYHGGTAKEQVKAGHKIVGVAWKDASLWILTRPMRRGEVPETLVLSESSPWGRVEGHVILEEVDSIESDRLRKLEEAKP